MALFWGHEASLLLSEHLLLASVLIDPAFSSHSSAQSMAKHTRILAVSRLVCLHLRPPQHRQCIGAGSRAVRGCCFLAFVQGGCRGTSRALKDGLGERLWEGYHPEQSKGARGEGGMLLPVRGVRGDT